MKQLTVFALALLFLRELPSANGKHSTTNQNIFPTLLPYIIAFSAVVLGLLFVVIYFCLIRAQADSSQKQATRRRLYNFKRKPRSADSTNSVNSSLKSNTSMVLQTRPNDNKTNKETVSEKLARLEYESRVEKLHLMRVD